MLLLTLAFLRVGLFYSRFTVGVCTVGFLSKTLHPHCMRSSHLTATTWNLYGGSRIGRRDVSAPVSCLIRLVRLRRQVARRTQCDISCTNACSSEKQQSGLKQRRSELLMPAGQGVQSSTSHGSPSFRSFPPKTVLGRESKSCFLCKTHRAVDSPPFPPL